MAKAKLSSKFQIVIPADVRRRLGLRPGDELVVSVEDERIVLEKAPSSYLERLRALGGSQWRGSSQELDRARDAWDG